VKRFVQARVNGGSNYDSLKDSLSSSELPNALGAWVTGSVELGFGVGSGNLGNLAEFFENFFVFSKFLSKDSPCKTSYTDVRSKLVSQAQE
jgi:hypothetical protein